MSLLRSDLMVALDAVIVACMEAADVHRTAAEGCGDAALADSLRGLADRRRHTARVLGDYLAAEGDGPNTPTEEVELFKKALAWAKATLSDDEAAGLKDCCGEERKVVQAAERALALDMPADVRRRLERLRDNAEARIREFAERIGSR